MILVTGGLGFIGSHTVQALLDVGEECVLVQRRAGASPFHLPVRVEQGDVTDREGLRDIAKRHGVTGIVHMAGSMPWPPSDEPNGPAHHCYSPPSRRRSAPSWRRTGSQRPKNRTDRMHGSSRALLVSRCTVPVCLPGRGVLAWRTASRPGSRAGHPRRPGWCWPRSVTSLEPARSCRPAQSAAEAGVTGSRPSGPALVRRRRHYGPGHGEPLRVHGG